MGVYINMEMPKDRPLIIKIAQDGTVYMSQGIYGIGHGVATAVPVPPHGRLGDLDELKTAFPCGESIRTESVRATIDHAPTIIPAEEGE